MQNQNTAILGDDGNLLKAFFCGEKSGMLSSRMMEDYLVFNLIVEGIKIINYPKLR